MTMTANRERPDQVPLTTSTHRRGVAGDTPRPPDPCRLDRANSSAVPLTSKAAEHANRRYVGSPAVRRPRSAAAADRSRRSPLPYLPSVYRVAGRAGGGLMSPPSGRPARLFVHGFHASPGQIGGGGQTLRRSLSGRGRAYRAVL